MARLKRVDINVEVIKDGMQKAKLDGAALARQLGRGDDYVNRALRVGKCTKSDLIAICALLGIKLDDALKRPHYDKAGKDDIQLVLSLLKEIKEEIDDIQQRITKLN